MRYKVLLLLMAVVVFRGVPSAALPGTNAPSVSAQEDFVVTIGEDKLFIEYNSHDSWFENDPDNPEPWPDQREAYSEGNIGRVSLSATPGHAGVAQAWAGVQFEWDLGGYTWEKVQDWPVTLSFDVSYEIETYWTPENGSADAATKLVPVTEPWYELIGSQPGYSSQTQSVVETFTTTPDGGPLTVGNLEEWGRRIGVLAYCHAHSVSEGGTTHYSSSEVQINSIKIEFGPLPVGGTQELPDRPESALATAESSHGSSPPYAGVAGVAAGGALLLAAGARYSMRRRRAG